MVLIAFFTDFFYNVIISWAIRYLVSSLAKELPWTRCGPWATENCFSGHMRGEKYPVCEYKDRLPICGQYEECLANDFCIAGPNFSYPILGRQEAMISSFKPQVGNLYNSTYAFYDNVTDSITLSAETMTDYCSWEPKTTSPAAEYFQSVSLLHILNVIMPCVVVY